MASPTPPASHDAPGAPLHPAVARLREVEALIARTCREEGRDPGSVTLVAVSKTHPSEAIEPVIEAGHRAFGENRVQEARAKWPALRDALVAKATGDPLVTPPPAAGSPLELHLIGPLQSNKAADAVALFDAIHTLDRESLALALAKAFERTERRPRLFVQVNTGEEAQKAGVAPADADRFIDRCRKAHGLRVEGLMAIPPVDEPAAGHFGLLARIARRNGVPLLSMGMSGDLVEAVRLGATHVRVGSAIFGAREGRAVPPGARAGA